MAKIFKNYLLIGDESPLEFQPTCDNHVGVVTGGVVGLVFRGEFELAAKNIVDTKKIKCDVLNILKGIVLFFEQNDYKNAEKVFTTCGLQCDVITENACVTLEQTVEETKKRSINGDTFEEIIEHQFVSEFVQTYDDLCEVPVYFRPLSKVNYHFLDEGLDGRVALFSHIQPLQTAHYKKSEIQEILKVINEWVLINPVTDEELVAITSEDAFDESVFFGERGKFLHNVFGDYMLANSEILNIDDQPHIYTRTKTYSNNPLEFERRMLDKLPSLKDTQRKEVYKYIQLQCRREGFMSPPKLIGLKDYILDIETMEQTPYSPDYIINNKIAYNYNENAYSEVVDKILNNVSCGDEKLRAMIEEMVGYTLYRSNKMQIAFFLTGHGKNGKSTVLEMIQTMLGKNNYASLSLANLEETFKPAELYGKLANFGDDIGCKFFEASDMFKKMATGDSVNVARKYGQPFDFSSYATLIYCANTMPPVNDRTDGFNRRMVIIPFENKFSKDDPDYDPFIDEKSKTDEAIQYLLKVGIEGLKRLLYNKEVTQAEASLREKAAFIKDNNPVLEWLDLEPELINQSTEAVYIQYCSWCAANGIKSLSLGKLSRELKKHANVETKSVYRKNFGTRREYVEIGSSGEPEEHVTTIVAKDTFGV